MRHTLAYGSDCGPCTRFRNAVEFLDARKAIRYVGLDEAEREGILDRMPLERRRRSFHLVSGDGRWYSGSEALAPLLALLPGGSTFAFVMSRSSPISRCAAFLYGVFSRLHDAGSCASAVGLARKTGTIDVDIKLDSAGLPSKLTF